MTSRSALSGAQVGLCGALAWAPLPLASNRPWSWSLLVTGLFALAAWIAWRGAGGGRLWSGLQRAAMAGFAVAVAWALAQALPGLGADRSPWDGVSVLIGRPGWQSLSLDPVATAEGALRLAGYGVAAWLGVALLGREPRAGLWVTRTLAATGAVLAVYALGVLVSGAQTIWWLDKWTYHDVATATFVNRNAYAVYAGVGVAAALVASGAARREGARWSWRAAAAFGLVAVVFTESRWGLACVLAGLATLALGRRTRWRVWLTVGVLGTALIFALLWATGRGRWLDRLDPGYLLGDLRWDLYRVTAGAILDRPWCGHGLGTFPTLYQRIRDESLVDHWVLQAHSVPLELVADLGVPAALALMAAFGALVLGCWRRVRREADPLARLALAAGVMTGLHGLLDFSLHMPAVAVTVAVLLGAGSTSAGRMVVASGSTPTSALGLGPTPAHGATTSRSGP